jgi:hypothetical protein
MAEVEAAAGIALDTNYYHYAPWLAKQGRQAHGYLTGSGLPQRFCTIEGEVLPVYQAATQWPDEWFDDFGFNLEDATTVVTDMLDAAEQRFPSFFIANIHHDRYAAGAPYLARAWSCRLWSAAQTAAIPLWSAEQLLDFVQARDGARFARIARDGETLRFILLTPRSGQDLSVLIPAAWKGRGLTGLCVDGKGRAMTTHAFRGRQYALVTTRAARMVVEACYTQRTPAHGGRPASDGAS